MININEIYRVKKIILQYWINTNIISTQVLLSYPKLQKNLTSKINRSASPNIFIKKKIDFYPFPNKKTNQFLIEEEHKQSLSNKKLSIVSQEPVIISKPIPSLAVQKAYSINSNQWNGKNNNSSTLLINYTKLTNINESKYQSIKHDTSILIEESSNYNIYNNTQNKKNSTIEQSQNQFGTLSLSTINAYESDQLSSTRNNLEKIRDIIDVKPTRTITAKTTNNITSYIRRENNCNKSDLHYKNVNNNYIEESSLEDLEERLNNEFLNNKYDIPLQINVSMFFEKRVEDMEISSNKNILKERKKININKYK